MGTIGKDFNYKIIKNFLSKDEIDLLSIYCEMKHRTNITSFDLEQSNVADTKYYGDQITDSLMLKKNTFNRKRNWKKIITYIFFLEMLHKIC